MSNGFYVKHSNGEEWHGFRKLRVFLSLPFWLLKSWVRDPSSVKFSVTWGRK